MPGSYIPFGINTAKDKRIKFYGIFKKKKQFNDF